MTIRFGDWVSEETVMPLLKRERPEESLDLVARSLAWGVQTFHLWGNLLCSGTGIPGLKFLAPLLSTE